MADRSPMGANLPHTPKANTLTGMGHIPQPNPAVDARSLPLTAQEGFILSRIDGRTTPPVLCDLVGVSADVMAVVLKRLHDLGAIRWLDGATSAPLQDDCDLTATEQQRIQDAEARVLTADFWVVLGVTGDSSAREIKRAYLQASKAFHPDRYFGRKLGPYQARMATLFTRIKEAYDVLSDPEARARYAADVPPPSTLESRDMPMIARMPGMALPQAAVQKNAKTAPFKEPVDEETLRLNARRAELKQRRGDRLLEKTGGLERAKEHADKAEVLYQQSLGQLRASKLIEACNSLRLATTLAPKNLTYQHAYQELLQRSVAIRAMRWNDQGDVAAASKDAAKAAEAYANASDLLPEDPHVARLAGRWLGVAGDWRRALTYLERAAHGMPNDATVSVALVEAHMAMGNHVVARQVAQEALARTPGYPALHDLLQRLMEQTGP